MSETEKPATEIHSQTVTNNFPLPEHKTLPVTVAWVAAVGTVLSGLSAADTAMHLPTSQPPPDPHQTQADVIHSQGLLGGSVVSEVNFAGIDYKAERHKSPASASTYWDHIESLKESRDSRSAFVNQFQLVISNLVPTEGEKAISCLLDPQQDEAHRMAAALYLGGQAKKEYISPLKIIAKQNDRLGGAATLALQMLNEHLAKTNSIAPPSIAIKPASHSLTPKAGIVP